MNSDRGPTGTVDGTDQETARWLSALTSDLSDRDLAIGELHELLRRAARAELRRRSDHHGVSGPELDDLADQAAGDASLAIIGKLTQFRGESRFTTWAYRFVMLEVSAKLGRHFWRRHPGLVLGDGAWERLPDRFGVSPEQHAQGADLAAAIRRAVEQELTEHQRRIFVALVVEGIPLDALAVRLGSNRNAIYKTMFDARRKVRKALRAWGYLVPDDPASHDRRNES